MAKVIIELEEADFMEVVSTLTEVKDTLIRIEGLLSTNHSITGMESTATGTSGVGIARIKKGEADASS